MATNRPFVSVGSGLAGEEKVLTQPLQINFNDGAYKKVALHLPACLRFRVIEVTEICTVTNRAKMRAMMNLTVMMAGLGQATIHKITENLKIRVNNDEILDMNPQTNPVIEKAFQRRYGSLNLMWKGIFPLSVALRDIFSVPYNKLKMEIYCTILPIEWKFNGQAVKVKFNVLDGPTQELMRLPDKDLNEDEYDFDLRSVRIRFEMPIPNNGGNQTSSPLRIIEEEEATQMPAFLAREVDIIDSKQNLQDRGTVNWQNIIYHFEMYRHPTSALVMVYLPVLLLSLIGLVIYFETNDSLVGKVLGIATLMVTFSTLLPTIRDKIIRTSKLTSMDLVLFSVLIINLLCLIKALINSRWEIGRVYDWRKDPFIIISIIIVLILFVWVIGRVLWHICVDTKNYRKRMDSLVNLQVRRDFTNACISVNKAYLGYGNGAYGYTSRLMPRDGDEEFVDVGKITAQPMMIQQGPFQPMPELYPQSPVRLSSLPIGAGGSQHHLLSPY